MKRLEDLRNIHKGEEIWVIGSGPSLDDFSDLNIFFKGKLTITVNWAREAVPNHTYSHHTHAAHSQFMAATAGMMQSLFERCILGEGKGNDFWSEWPIYMTFKGSIEDEKVLAENVKLIMEGKPCGYNVKNTSMHGALQAAAVLGASKITLVGCEHGYAKDLEKPLSHARCLAPYYKGTCDMGFHQEAIDSHVQKMLRGTRCFAREFGKYGIKVRRYYFGKGYEEITDKGIIEE